MRSRSSSSSSSTFLLATAVALGILIAAATALAAAIPADKAAETALPTISGPEGSYLRDAHERVHGRWAGNFLRQVSERLPVSDAINDSTRATTVDLVLGGDGQILSLDVAKSAGVPGFDDAAKEVLRDSAPFPIAAVDVLSDDRLVHLRWTFARDERRCAGVTVVRTEEPLPIALPKLMSAGREAEAMRRVRVAREAGAAIDPMLTTIAGAWLKMTINRPYETVDGAEMLATLGDSAGIGWLRTAVKRPELARAAGRALARHHVPICPIVGPALSATLTSAPASAAEQMTAALALATAGEAECAPGLIALLENHKARPEARVAAAVALGPIAEDNARKSLNAATKDDNTSVRAAAILAGARPGSGRGKVLALVTPLRDPIPEVRAAAAAGIVRAGGDANLDDLYVIFKDSDPRPAAAVAAELDHLRSEEATKLLVRLLKRPHVSVQLAAARALINRGARDSFPALRPFLDIKVDAELRGLALVSADASTLDNIAKVVASSDGKDPKVVRLALATYRARLARAERGPAGDLLIANVMKLSPAERATAMAEWMAGSNNPAAATAAAISTTAAVTKTPAR